MRSSGRPSCGCSSSSSSSSSGRVFTSSSSSGGRLLWSRGQTRPRRRASLATAHVATTTTTAAPPARDLTADILQAAFAAALKKRLTSYDRVDAHATCDARGLLEGRFAGMRIAGAGWQTPLGMTAHRLEVAIGEMHVDLPTLLLERRVAMANVPTGRVAIFLSGRDMGAFLGHPLFRQAAATAVQGEEFEWDRDSVEIDHAQAAVWFSGTWAGNGRRYRMLMRPGGGGSGSSSSPSSSSRGHRRPPLQVGAQLLGDDGAPVADAAAHAATTQAVAAGMANFFTSMSLDLQGIEIRNPVLRLSPGDTSQRGEGDLLEIAMSLRLRALPPMNMQF